MKTERGKMKTERGRERRERDRGVSRVLMSYLWVLGVKAGLGVWTREVAEGQESVRGAALVGVDVVRP